MPLETPRKPVQEFSDVGSYPTSDDLVKRASELRNENKLLFKFMGPEHLFWDGKYYKLPKDVMGEVHKVLDKYVK